MEATIIISILLFVVYVVVPFLIFTWTVALYARLDAEDAENARRRRE
jgi:uncharacterized membrane protein